MSPVCCTVFTPSRISCHHITTPFTFHYPQPLPSGTTTRLSVSTSACVSVVFTAFRGRNPANTSSSQGAGVRWGGGCAGGRGRGAQPTDGAVLPVPALAALALAVLAGPVLRAARVAGSLIAGGARPAFLAATRAPHADPVRAAVHGADFCRERGADGRERQQGVRRERRSPVKVNFTSTEQKSQDLCTKSVSVPPATHRYGRSSVFVHHLILRAAVTVHEIHMAVLHTISYIIHTCIYTYARGLLTKQNT